MSHMKEQNKAPEEFTEMEASNIQDAELETLIIRMLKELRGRVDELGEDLNKEMENINVEMQNEKRSRSDVKNAVSEMRSTFEGIHRGHEAGGRISELEDGGAEDTQPEQHQEKKNAKK